MGNTESLSSGRSCSRLLTRLLVCSCSLLTSSLQEDRELPESMESNDSTEMVGGREDSSGGGVRGREGTAVILVMRDSVTVIVARVCEACEGKRSTMETCPE